MCNSHVCISEPMLLCVLVVVLVFVFIYRVHMNVYICIDAVCSLYQSSTSLVCAICTDACMRTCAYMYMHAHILFSRYTLYVCVCVPLLKLADFSLSL